MKDQTDPRGWIASLAEYAPTLPDGRAPSRLADDVDRAQAEVLLASRDARRRCAELEGDVRFWRWAVLVGTVVGLVSGWWIAVVWLAS